MARTTVQLKMNETRMLGAYVWSLAEVYLSDPKHPAAKFQVDGGYWQLPIGQEYHGVKLEKVETSSVEVSY